MNESFYKWLGLGKSNTQLKKSKYVFLLSHMRSYSTLLSHIIGSHPSIAGYIENHQSYIRDFHFAKMRYKLHLLHGTSTLPPYLFDKILHNDYHINPDYLTHPNVYPIIVLREPIQTVKSIVHMGNSRSTSPAWYRDIERVSKYYVKRSRRLEKYSQMARGRALFLVASELKEDTYQTLARITKFLELDSPLREEYETFNFTGTSVLGDPSENIKSGKIVSAEHNYDHINLPDELSDRLRQRFWESVKNLRSNCQTIE